MYDKEIANLKSACGNLSLAESLELVASIFENGVTFSTSFGLEDQALTHAIYKSKANINVFTLDTGRLFNETYDLYACTEARYKLKIKPYYPNQDEIQEYVITNGINAFYESVDNRKECCRIRKIEPLKKALAGAKVWITGVRAEQSANRTNFNLFDYDPFFGLIKFNPLLHWTIEELKAYIKENKIPYNPLHDKGFASIGCQPCTRAIVEGEHERDGRWWWETSHKECGLHQSK